MAVDLVEELGADTYVYGSLRVGDTPERVVVLADPRTAPAIGDHVTVTVRDPREIHLFDPAGGARLLP
jgi:multiple sugar transport system ATP-binding protein